MKKICKDGSETAAYETTLLWLEENLELFADEVTKQQLRTFLPSVWRKAVLSAKRAAVSEETKNPSEAEKKQQAEKALSVEISDLDATGSSIGGAEFALFVADSLYICVSDCPLSKETDPATDNCGKLEGDDVVRILEGPTSFLVNGKVRQMFNHFLG